MIATLSPASYNFEETLSTLRYANRAKSIKNKPVVNEDPKDTMLREYQEEIENLRRALEARKQGGAPRIITKSSKSRLPKRCKAYSAKKNAPESDLVDEVGNQTESESQNYAFSDVIEESIATQDKQGDDESSLNVEQNIITENSSCNLAQLDPETIAKLQAEVEAEKRALASKDIVIEEKERIAMEQRNVQQILEKERQEREF
ncbi:hypothetical protein BSLG_005655 [Batrachochytrium salamandrivorans]|nr:hypothetical protein BSLG_005655 [Batrachochytrium salamandrivorans]